MNVRPFLFVGWFAVLLLAAGKPAGVIVQPMHILLHETFDNSLTGRWKVIKLGEGKGTGSVHIASESDGTHFVELSTAVAFYGIGMEEKFDPSAYPEMSWRWRVTRLPDDADIARKRADDAAARLYVVFNNQSLLHPFGTTALVYVWDTRYPLGSVVPNPYAPDREKVIVLRSGTSRLGQWVAERVDLIADYQRAFGRTAPPVKAIIFASDSDNTHSATVADFTDLTLSTASEYSVHSAAAERYRSYSGCASAMCESAIEMQSLAAKSG